MIDAYFDEAAPHNLLQLDCVKSPGDLLGEWKLIQDCLIKSSVVFSEHKVFDGVAVPMYCKSVLHETMPKKLYRHHEQSCRITKLDFSPDFAALKAFELTDIREGATVHDLGRPGLKYAWRRPKSGP